MSEHWAIECETVGKRYRLRAGGTPTVKRAILDALRGGRSRGREFWALQDVSIKVRKGETLGIIGFNGAGKSTLLSLLAKTKVPTCGRVEIRGTVSSLLELGAGFHPDLTGRENVFLCGAVMGLSRAQMAKRFDAIVAFAGLEDFIDQPVRHYSSGMYIRLGFAVAVEVDPDVILIDEVLAVGDINFQSKCLERMREFREQGKTMLMISHDLKTLQSISDRILLLNEGRIIGIGEPEDLVGQYETLSRDHAFGAMKREWGTGEAKLTHVTLRNARGEETATFRNGESLMAHVAYETSIPIDDPVFGFAISDEKGRLVHGSNTQIAQCPMPNLRGEGTVTLHLDKLPLASGTYLLSFSLHSSDHKVNYHRLDHAVPIVVECDSRFEGLCEMPSRWESGSAT